MNGGHAIKLIKLVDYFVFMGDFGWKCTIFSYFDQIKVQHTLVYLALIA